MTGETKKGYITTHIGTYRYRCKVGKSGGFIILQTGGTYESLASFKDLPPFKEFKKKGRKWIHTKTYNPVMDRILLDIDSDDLSKALEVTRNLMQEFTDYADFINVYFSGNKGFHLELITEELDIVDITAEKPKDSCNPYEEFLNYWNSKYNEVDTRLKDVGSRVIRRHHTKHEKTGNYKILVDINASLDKILANSKANKDMLEPKTALLDKDKALYLLNQYSKPVTPKQNNSLDDLDYFEVKAESVDYDNVGSWIYTKVFNDLNTNIHDKIKLIGAGLNGYVDNAEMLEIYNILAKTTDIEDSENAKNSFIEVYQNDQKPCNLGALYYHYKNNDLNLDNFFKLSEHLKSKQQSKDYDRFNDILQSHNDDWYQMLEAELFDYVDNTENIFNGIIHCLMAEFGYGSRFVVVNAGSEVGKSEYINTIKKLMPKFKNLGSSTPASIRRQHELAFNKKTVYLGDKGLRGKTQSSKEEFEGLYEVFGGLITENEFIRDVVDGGSITQCKLKSDGVCVFFTEPYTNLRVFGAGDQYSTRSTYITLNPVEDGLSLFLQDEDQPNEFYNIHKNYIRHILKNPIKVTIDNQCKTALWYASNGSLRTAKYTLGLFKAYCQYLQIGNPLKSDVDKFLQVFRVRTEVTDIEIMIYTKLYQNLHVLTEDDLSYLITEDGGVADIDDMLLQAKDRKNKSFFTAKQIKTYFKRDFKMNKNLKDTIDQIPDILNNLYNADYIHRLEWQHNNQNVYYIPYNEDMDK